jgi:hypothetical protein
MSDTPKEHDETDYEMIERVFNSDPKLRAALAEKICGPQSNAPRPRTVTVTEHDERALGAQYCARRSQTHLVSDARFPCDMCLSAARDFLASLPDAHSGDASMLQTDERVQRALMPFLFGEWGMIPAGLLRDLSEASFAVGQRAASLPHALHGEG